jgi:hypothetical protein
MLSSMFQVYSCTKTYQPSPSLATKSKHRLTANRVEAVVEESIAILNNVSLTSSFSLREAYLELMIGSINCPQTQLEASVLTSCIFSPGLTIGTNSNKVGPTITARSTGAVEAVAAVAAIFHH